MLKKEIEFKDLDGNPLVETFYFNLTSAEIAEMELSQKGGLAAHFRQVIDDADGAKIIAIFKELIAKAYGERSEDGKRFIKSDELSQAFLQTDAYSVLFMELVTDADAAVKFIHGVVPADLAEKIEKGEDVLELPEKKEYTRDELLKMSDAEFDEVAGTDLTLMTRENLIIATQRKLAKK